MVQVQYATWFLPSTSPGKFQAVEPDLADRLEASYHLIKPWLPSYEDELKAALVLGAEAEQKRTLTSSLLA